MSSRDELIQNWASAFIAKVNAARRALGIKHNRTAEARDNKVSFKKEGGEIAAISVRMMKGDVMTHKGLGKNPENRKPKPFYNPIAETEIPQLADALAENWGDVIAKELIQ